MNNITQLSDIKFPSVGHRQDGTKYPFQVLMNGSPFAGFDTPEEAAAAAKMYNAPRPGSKGGTSSFVFTVG